MPIIVLPLSQDLITTGKTQLLLKARRRRRRHRYNAISFSNDDDFATNQTSSPSSFTQQQFATAHIAHHHSAIKSRNITNAIDFYSLLGFRVETKFVSGPARAAWLIHESSSSSEMKELPSQSISDFSRCRIELIEVPSYMLDEPEGMKKRAINLIERPELLGLNHVALDVTRCIIASRSSNINNNNDDNDDDSITDHQGMPSFASSSCALYQLREWIDDLNTLSLQKFGKSLRVAVPPTKRLVGRQVYEMAFLLDADGSLVELLNHCGTLEQEMSDGWLPWDGQGFAQ